MNMGIGKTVGIILFIYKLFRERCKHLKFTFRIVFHVELIRQVEIVIIF